MIVVELKTIFSFEGREIDEYPLNGTEALTNTHSIGANLEGAFRSSERYIVVIGGT